MLKNWCLCYCIMGVAHCNNEKLTINVLLVAKPRFTKREERGKERERERESKRKG